MNHDPNTTICPNCGAARPADIPRCSNCGATAGAPPTKCRRCGAYRVSPKGACQSCGAYPGPTGKTWLWLVLFILIGIPAGCSGACFALVASTGRNGEAALGLLAGLLGAALFVGFLVMLVRSARR